MNTIETIQHVRDIDPDYPAYTVLLKGRIASRVNVITLNIDITLINQSNSVLTARAWINLKILNCFALILGYYCVECLKEFL